MQQLGQSPGAQFTWWLLKTLATTFVTGSIGMACYYVKDIRDDVRAAGTRIEMVERKQDSTDSAEALTAQRVDNLSRVSDQTILTLRQLGDQVSRDHDDISQLKIEGRRR